MKETPESSSELLGRLVDSHHEQLFRFAFFRIGSQADAEDVVQEAYLRLASCDLTRIANPKAYLFRTVANGCCDLLHRKTRLRPLDRRIETVDDEYDAREEYERIEALLRELPEEQADVIRLHTAGALRFTEIAELLDRPVSTVKSRFRYGIDRLRHSLNVFDKPGAEPNAVRVLPRRETDEKNSTSKTTVIMKCTDFQTRIPELLDGSADLSDDMKRHLAQCPVCTAEYEAARRTLDAVTPRCRVRPSDGFRERLLGTLSRAERNRRSRRRTLRIVTATLSAAAIVALILLPGFRTPAQAARGCFRNAAAALDKARTLRMELRIRTQPQENFSFTDPEGEFVPHVVQAVYAPVLRWRVEKPDRKALFDGRRTLLWQPSLQEGLELPAGTCVLEELGMLLDPRMLFATEERAAEIAGGTYTLTEERDTIRLNVTAPARGDFSESRYMLNSSITQSNTRREYLFDRKSGHLLKARIVALTGAGERTLLETDRIDYDLPIDTVQLTTPPAGIAWLDRTQPLAGEKLAGITAEEAARRILQAMTVWDEAIIDEAFSFYGAKLRGMLRKDYEGAADFEVGAPFRSGAYPGYFVPCVFRMPDGSTRQLRLALRNDNPSGSWIVDGGI